MNDDCKHHQHTLTHNGRLQVSRRKNSVLIKYDLYKTSPKNKKKTFKIPKFYTFRFSGLKKL